MYKITITPEDPCGPDDKLEASGDSLLDAVWNFFGELHEKTSIDDLVDISDMIHCVSEVVGMMERDDELKIAESKYGDMDPAYSFTVKCERLASNGK